MRKGFPASFPFLSPPRYGFLAPPPHRHVLLPFSFNVCLNSVCPRHAIQSCSVSFPNNTVRHLKASAFLFTGLRQHLLPPNLRSPPQRECRATSSGGFCAFLSIRPVLHTSAPGSGGSAGDMSGRQICLRGGSLQRQCVNSADPRRHLLRHVPRSPALGDASASP